MLGCTVEDIASMLNVDKKTFHKFMDDHPEARQARRHGVGMCKLSLRRAQFRHAKTSWRAAFHLGRLYLADQREAYLEERSLGRLPRCNRPP